MELQIQSNQLTKKQITLKSLARNILGLINVTKDIIEVVAASLQVRTVIHYKTGRCQRVIDPPFLVQLHMGYEACIAMPHRPSFAATPLFILMYPSSPQLVPHEFFTNQYLAPSLLVPWSTAVRPWSGSVPHVPVNTPPE